MMTKVFRMGLLLAVLGFGTAAARAQVTLSELLAVPGPGSLDNDGDPSGWIEISNIGGSAISLDGYYLTDDAANLPLWGFPAVTVPPGGSLVVWASGKDRASAAAPLHTSFTLNAAGGYLALVEPGGVNIASEFAPSYPQQFDGISYGRNYSGGTAVVDLVPFGSTANYLVPLDGSLGTSWSEAPGTFDDSSWSSGVAPLGYGFVSGQTITTDIFSEMRGVNATAYFRFPFAFDASSNSAQNMTLTVIIDDGFAAYVNGVEVANFHSPPSPTWNSAAESNAEGQVVTTPVTVDLSTLLVDGANVLAIQAMNASLGSSDFMVEAELKATVQDISGGQQAGYFETPTPGVTNGVTKDGQTITFEPLVDVPFTAAPIDLVATSTSGLAVAFEVVSGNATVSGAALTLTGIGAVTVRAVQPGDVEFIAAAPVEQSFLVTTGSQTIDFPPVGTRNFLDEPIAPLVSASSGLPVALVVLSGPATFADGLLTLTGAGTVNLRASQAGDANWAAATDVDVSFLVELAAQSIDFPQPADRAFDGLTFGLSATAESGLAVSFEMVAGPADLDGAMLTTTGAGVVTVRATQSGDADYAAAASVEQSFLAGYDLDTQAGVGGAIFRSPTKPFYAPGEIVSVQIAEDANYRFTTWGGALSGATSPGQVTMDSHQTVSAEFKRIWDLNVSAGDHGNVTIDPQQVEFLDGDVITLTPVPEEGYALESWSGSASGNDSPLVLTMSADTAVTAQFHDVQSPVVQIFSPAGGTTNNQFAALFGTVSDNAEGTTLTWERNGEAQGQLPAVGGSFSVTDLVLRPSDNTFTVTATDAAGNIGGDEVTITWEPDRTLFLEDAPETSEGNLFTLPIKLDSAGAVGGMTFVLDYDPQFVGSPEVSLNGNLGISQANIDTPGEVRMTFALPSTSLAAGETMLGEVTFRARSVPFNLTTQFGLTVSDVSGADGNQIEFGTHTIGAEARILQRNFNGDINTNDRLDTGDAFLMQRLLTGADEVRTWDHGLNDLNSSSVLDSGDVVRLLRVVVGIDDQPELPQARGRRGSGSAPEIGAHLVMEKNYVAEGDEVTVRVMLDAPGYAPAGASFSLSYPVEALRLVDADSHVSGEMVSTESLVLWNVSPSQDDYAAQDGRISFVASASAPWADAAEGGELASFTFKVQSGAAQQAVWDLELEGLELPTADGYGVIELADASAPFIGQPTTFSEWADSQIGADPAMAAAGADPDGDGIDNLGEYARGTDPMLPDVDRSQLRFELADSTISFERSLTAVDLSSRVEVSGDLKTWQSIDLQSANVSRTREKGSAIERVTVRDQGAAIGEQARRFLRVVYETAAE